MMMVAISASTAFLTPIGHQANVLVYNSGGYKFFDFVRVGGPLTLLILLVSLAVVPWSGLLVDVAAANDWPWRRNYPEWQGPATAAPTYAWSIIFGSRQSRAGCS